MKGWRIGWIWALLLCIPILLTAANNPGLLRDTDTIALVERIAARNDPLSWWMGDWPLFNHFYRPAVTMVFELDRALHPGSAAGYGFFNALLCAGCVVSLFWFLRELTDEMSVAIAGTTLFALWTVSPKFSEALPPIGVAVGVVGLLGGLARKNWGLALLSFAAGLALSPELAGLERVRGGTMDWIPGRTATTMTLFGFLALAAYARFERLKAFRPTFEPSPFDIPATRSTTVEKAPSRWVWAWVPASFLFAALALASYEQAVMLPALYLSVVVSLWIRGHRPKPWIALSSWLLVVGYMALRKAVIPPGVSQYQDQQLRQSLDVFLTLCDYLFPAARQIHVIIVQLDLGIASLLITQMGAFVAIAAVIAAYVGLANSLKRRWAERQEYAWLLSGYAMSFLAFLPMAWLKPFQQYNHYHYFSMGFRSLFAAVACMILVRIAISAASPRGRQAPARLAPAPGSLPRP